MTFKIQAVIEKINPFILSDAYRGTTRLRHFYRYVAGYAKQIIGFFFF